MVKNNFSLVDKEIDRQFSLALDIDKALDTKAIFILGFISVGLSILVKMAGASSSWTVLSGIYFLIAGLMAMISFWVRSYYLGPSPKDLVSLYKKDYKYLDQLIAKTKWIASKANQQKVKSKAKFIKFSLIFLLSAISSLVIGLVI